MGYWDKRKDKCFCAVTRFYPRGVSQLFLNVGVVLCVPAQDYLGYRLLDRLPFDESLKLSKLYNVVRLGSMREYDRLQRRYSVGWSGEGYPGQVIQQFKYVYEPMGSVVCHSGVVELWSANFDSSLESLMQECVNPLLPQKKGIPLGQSLGTEIHL